MRQTFNLPIDEHKREALLTYVGSALRDSIGVFVIKPQIAKLNGQDERGGEYLRFFSHQMDEVQLEARHSLSDYLDYLSVKANCNITLGAPLTHDMLAIRSFIFVDRSKQELLVSPMKRSASQMSRQSMFEADFCANLLQSTSKGSSSEISDYEISENNNGELIGGGSLASGDSANEGDSSSISDVDELSSMQKGEKLKQPSARVSGHKVGVEMVDEIRLRNQWLLGTSADLLAATTTNSTSNNSASGSRRSLATSNSISDLSFIQAQRRSIDQLNLKDRSSLKDLQLQQQQQQLVDENLIKSFTCFIYNRLSHGQGSSFSSNDGQYC